MSLKPTLAAWLALATALPFGAAAAEPEISALADCRREPDDAKRLACYDREMDRLGAANDDAAPPQTPEERFGRSGAMNREESDRMEREARDLTELNATATEIWTRADGLMIITLDNGQIWKQNRPDSLFRLKVGERVKIQPAALGSFLLSGPSKRSTRVTRIK